jgi:hypothetical protein
MLAKAQDLRGGQDRFVDEVSQGLCLPTVLAAVLIPSLD